MPIETRSRTTTNTTKPITPTLSSNLRTRPTFTPRLAGTGPVSPAPTTQRSLRQFTLSPERSEDEAAKSLSSNVTPRSGARNSRIEIEPLLIPDSAEKELGSIRGTGKDMVETTGVGEMPNSIGTPIPSVRPLAQRLSSGSTTSQVKSAGKFFRADDVKTTPTNTKTTGARAKTTDSNKIVTPKLSPRKLPSGSDSGVIDKKFFYANNVAMPQSKATRPIAATKLLSTASTQSLPTLGSKTLEGTVTHSPRDKTSVDSVNSPKQSTPQPLTQTPSSINAPSALAGRRRSSSLNVRALMSNAPGGHRKSLSTSTVSVGSPQVDGPRETVTIPESPKSSMLPIEVAFAQRPIFPLSPSYTSPRSNSFASISSIDKLERSGSIPFADSSSITPIASTARPRKISDSPTVKSALQSQLEAAANARRERKVLDLEISNSSLLAINKTLEKELRKQNAELRRFRRLSRSGRLSLIPSERNFSGLSALSLATVDESEIDSAQTFSPGSSGDGLSDGDEDYDDGASDEGSSLTESSGAMRRRARDEKRLLLDLQRHQQILIDSQKLTQSIQRCLNCTDELIKDGNKALAYEVEAEDMKIGGRVLSNDDEELSEVDFDEYSQSSVKPRQGLLSPAITMNTLEEASLWFKGLQSINEGHKLDLSQNDQDNQHTDLAPSPSLTMSPVILPEDNFMSP